jgi:crotonobetainyl-CoA:carnitine CoA-transferase CaiB-like acyl-CoA transferase
MSVRAGIASSQEPNPMAPADALAALWDDLGLPAEALGSIALDGADPVLPSSFRIGTLAQTTIAAVALAAAEFHRRRAVVQQQIRVGMREAAIEFRSERYARIAGMPTPDMWDRIAGAYRCGDGGWVRLHTNFPHHRDGVLRLLDCGYNRAAVAAALEHWQGQDLEDVAAAAGLVAAKARSFAEWDAHPQAQAVRNLPLVSVERIGDAPVPATNSGSRPLERIRVLELTRVLAGPICGRVLAGHGADSIRVISPTLPTIEAADIDTGRGKRSAYVDFTGDDGRRAFSALLAGADIFVQSYRPGALANRGLGPADAARMRPGIIYVSLSAYGNAGPWADRRGFDSLVQTATGMNVAEAEAAGETGLRPLPSQALDHAAGYLMALGALVALLRRAEQGGSWHVQVSLARTGLWLRSLGRVADGFSCPEMKFADIKDRLEAAPSGYGELSAVRHAAELSATPAQWARPSTPFGTDPPRW